jgi:cellulose synthase/poly-beta-1,6-N-acetylglucosamine synthase-like glycosyltransferase
VLDRAEAEAERHGVAAHDVLLASRAMSPLAYAEALARHLGVALADRDTIFGQQTDERAGNLREQGLPAHLAGRPHWVLCAEDHAPEALRQQIGALQARGLHVAVAPRCRIEEALEELWRADRIDRAVVGLFREQPASSAKGGIWPWQLAAAALAATAAVGSMSLVPDVAIAVLTGFIALPFLCVTVLRLVALREVVAPSREARGEIANDAPGLPGRLLPIYTVLVPLLRETGVVEGLVRSLSALDYPAAKLEIVLVLEASDIDTQAAVRALQLPASFRIVVVPDAPPQTKPKALNYALQFARGEYVVVYDAEDRPQPGQLRRALEAFRSRPSDLGCVQARLNIYNPRASWFTRQFTIEYSALFDAILPALVRLSLPVPLGGTSNHFRRETLVAVGGWDPFNVTEDADLGFRLARQGWRTTVLKSTTWEEAPATFGRWFRQRTRWLKGWMQTYLVHTRRPWRLNSELGWRGALGLHVLMGGLILSALAHPWFYALLVYHTISGQLFAPAGTLAGAAFWTIACINLGAGYLTSILVGALSVWRRGRPGLALSALLMPLTWLLVSAAAYRALYQLVTRPYLWEKTEHGPLRRSP